MNLLKMRVSIFWHQSWIRTAPPGEPGVIDRGRHFNLMDEPRRQQSGPLTAPWPPDRGQGFWERYLGLWRELDWVDPREAWRYLVPLRSAAAPLDIVADGDDTKVMTEGFLHPWGGSLLTHLTLTGDWPDLASAADRIRELRRESCFTQGNAGPFRLDDLAKQGLHALCPLAVDATPGRVSEGFSVFSVLTAVGDPAEFDPREEATGVARFLHAVTSFSSTWRQDTLPALAAAKVAGKSTSPAAHLVYGSARARAIWSPTHFTITQEQRDSPQRNEKRIAVGCHHRNLTLASTQVEAMSRFVAEAADRLEGGRLANEHASLAGCAAARLGDLYIGTNDTYRSGALRAQIDAGPFLAAINVVRTAREMPPIV